MRKRSVRAGGTAHRETLQEADDEVIPLVASHEPVETRFGRFLSAAFD